MRHLERHRAARVSWLRAAVLGANDGIVSTASLLVGVAAADASHAAVLTAGIAGVVAGAMSMAAGEFVSVHSQADAEKADLDRERRELETALDDRREVDVLREPGLASCAGCGSLLPSDARFCPACGRPVAS